MPGRLVCDIHFYLYLRFVFGFCHEFESKRLRWLAKCYCYVMCANIIFWMFAYCHNVYQPLSTLLITGEYLLYVLISLRKNNKYLLRYYKKIFIDDVKTAAYEQMRHRLKLYVLMLIVFKIIGFLKYTAFHWHLGGGILFFAFLEFSTWCANVLGRSPVLFVLALLHARVRAMREALEGGEFQCRGPGQCHPRRLMQAYEAILDGLEASDNPVKLQAFVSIVFGTMFFTFELLHNLYYLRAGIEIAPTLDLIWFMMEIALGLSPLFAAVILADMVTMELQEMLVTVLKRRIDCKNERDRGEVQMLFQLLKARPFEYSLWRAVPLTLRSLLALLSFCVTSIIAVLQIKDWFQ